VRLRQDEVEAAYYAVAGFIRLCELDPRRSKPPPPEVRRLYRKFDAAVRVSPTRHESGCGAEDAGPSEVWIGSTEAARMVGWCPRQVQRRALELCGQRTVGGCWVFPLSEVVAFVAERSAGDAA
jgi:hypothetical protein